MDENMNATLERNLPNYNQVSKCSTLYYYQITMRSNSSWNRIVIFTLLLFHKTFVILSIFITMENQNLCREIVKKDDNSDLSSKYFWLIKYVMKVVLEFMNAVGNMLEMIHICSVNIFEFWFGSASLHVSSRGGK